MASLPYRLAIAWAFKKMGEAVFDNPELGRSNGDEGDGSARHGLFNTFVNMVQKEFRKRGIGDDGLDVVLDYAKRVFLTEGLPEMLASKNPQESEGVLEQKMLEAVLEAAADNMLPAAASSGGGGRLPPTNNTPTVSATPPDDNDPKKNSPKKNSPKKNSPTVEEVYEDPVSAWQKEADYNQFLREERRKDAELENEIRMNEDYRQFLRDEKRKDVEFDRELDRDNQEYVDEKLSKYYKKPTSQWAKELALEAGGRAAQGAGEGYDVYNSILANAIMQSAANSVPQAQAAVYGNSALSGASLVAGSRQARGKIGSIVGKQLGSFLRGWSNDIAAEYQRERMLRIQLEAGGRPTGYWYDSISKAGARERAAHKDF